MSCKRLVKYSGFPINSNKILSPIDKLGLILKDIKIFSTNNVFVGEIIEFSDLYSKYQNERDLTIQLTPYACLLQNPTTTYVRGRLKQDKMFNNIYTLEFTKRAQDNSNFKYPWIFISSSNSLNENNIWCIISWNYSRIINELSSIISNNLTKEESKWRYIEGNTVYLSSLDIVCARKLIDNFKPKLSVLEAQYLIDCYNKSNTN